MVVVVPPGFQLLAGIDDTGEGRLVQEVVALASIDALYEAVLAKLSRRDVVPFDIGLLAPAQDRYAYQFRDIVAYVRVGPPSGASEYPRVRYTGDACSRLATSKPLCIRPAGSSPRSC